MKRLEMAWLAGLLEGEGCFFLSSGNSPAVRLKMADEDVVARAHKSMGGRFYRDTYERRQNWTKLWCCEVYGEPALRLMDAVLPEMGKRRTEKILEIKSNVTTNHINSCAQRTISISKYWEDHSKREAQSELLKGVWVSSPTLKRDQSARFKKLRNSPEFKSKHAAALKRAWADPEKRKLMMGNRNKNKSKGASA